MIFYILFALIFFVGFLSFWGFWQAVHPQKIVSNLTPKELGWGFEEVSLKTEDGLALSAWFIPTENKTNKTIILLHGYPADKGDLLRWSTFLKDHYNLFFFDFRYFGKSEGGYTSLGFHERKDVLAAIEFLKNKGIRDIGLMGYSFGASVALLTLPQTSDVKVVVADSAFANLDLMGKPYYANYSFLHKPLTILTKFWGRVVYGIDADEVAPEQAVKNAKIPIFIIASRQDELVLVENAERLKEALRGNQNAKFWIYDRGLHKGLGGDAYQEKILQFFKKNL
jgi:dipeptidyl aminopeptidase/acylaminoacyl peptidase